MALMVIGASHHTLGLDELAAIAPIAQRLGAALAADERISGAVVLATCNRFEVYLDSPRFHEGVDAVMAAIQFQLVGSAGSELDPVTRQLAKAAISGLAVQVGEGAVRHCIQVTSGLDSMVVGEVEISGQVRAALAGARGAMGGRVSPALHRLFQHALATSKAVTARTQLGQAGRSVASVALDLVAQRHGPISERRVLIIGTGAYARVITAELTRRGCTQIAVHSPTGREQQFARSHPVRPVPESQLVAALAAAQLVVTCSGGQGTVLDEVLLATARADAQAAVPIVDLSLGRDVAEAAAALPGVDLIDLEAIGEFAPAAAAPAVLAAQDIVDRAVGTFLHLEGGRAADPAVVAMRSHIMGIIGTELELVERKYPPEVAQAVAHSLRRVSNELLHTPSVRAQELARSGDLADYHRAMSTLFGIDVPPAEGSESSGSGGSAHGIAGQPSRAPAGPAEDPTANGAGYWAANWGR